MLHRAWCERSLHCGCCSLGDVFVRPSSEEVIDVREKSNVAVEFCVDHTGVHSVGSDIDAFFHEPSVQLACMQDVGKLAGAVGLPLVVVSLALQVVPLESASVREAVRDTGHVNDTGRRRSRSEEHTSELQSLM